jgi:group I intron endonuclease
MKRAVGATVASTVARRCRKMPKLVILPGTEDVGVYGIRCKLDKKVYVGSTNSFKTRWKHHRGCLERNKHWNKHLQYAWNKHGADNFEFVVFVHCKPEDRLKWEQRYIDILKAADTKYGYNKRPIADSPLWVKHSEETIEKFRNKVFTEEHRTNISEAKKGKKRPPMTLQARMNAKLAGEKRRGRKTPADVVEKRASKIRGRKWTEEERAKHAGWSPSEEFRKHLSEVNTGKKQSEETKAKKSASLKAAHARRKARLANAVTIIAPPIKLISFSRRKEEVK